MAEDTSIKRMWARICLEQSKGDDLLDYEELNLFEWYARESASTFERMRGEVEAYISEQRRAVSNDLELDDSGRIAMEYYLSRARYADIVYLTSLLESYLSKASEKLGWVIGGNNVNFRPRELRGSKWERHKTFLERHGVSEFPKEPWEKLEKLINIRNDVVHGGDDHRVAEGEIFEYLSAFRALVEHVTREIDGSTNRRLRYAK
ncbi:MAG: HEPN domain-containing protein [Paracoccaceae bacterium]